MKKTLSVLIGIGAIYLFLWALSGLFSPGDVFIDTYLTPSGTITSANVYKGQKSTSRGLVIDLSPEEINSIVPNIIYDSSLYKPGRQILCLSNYTTGSFALDLIPFMPFNAQYKIISTADFDNQLGIDNYSQYFNLFHMSDYALAWIFALVLISLLLIPMALNEYFEKKKNEKAYKITSITGKIAGLLVLSKFYFNDGLYISIKVFLNSSFLHLIVIAILAMLITQITNIQKPLDKFKID